MCILKKEVLGIKKDTCVFIAKTNLSNILIFYLKEDSKNIELAKEVWINELNYGDFKGKTEFRALRILNASLFFINSCC